VWATKGFLGFLFLDDFLHNLNLPRKPAAKLDRKLVLSPNPGARYPSETQSRPKQIRPTKGHEFTEE